MMLRKIKDRIYLGVFNLKFMNWLDTLLYDELLNCENNRYLTNLFVCPNEHFFEFYYIRIDSTGEAYLTLETAIIRDDSLNCHRFFRFDFSENVVKNLFKTHLDILSSFTILKRNDSSMCSDSLDTYTILSANKRKLRNDIKKLQALINVWEGTASEEEMKMLGQPLDPFKLAAYNFNEAWVEYNQWFCNDEEADYDCKFSDDKIRKIFRNTLK